MYGTTRIIDLTAAEAEELATQLAKKAGGSVMVGREAWRYNHIDAPASKGKVWFAKQNFHYYAGEAGTVADAIKALDEWFARPESDRLARAVREAQQVLVGAGYTVTKAAAAPDDSGNPGTP